MKKLILYLIVLFAINDAFSQNQSTIDSLQKVLQTTTADTHKIDVYNLIAHKYRDSDSTKVTYYTSKAIFLSEAIHYPKGIVDAYYLRGWAAMRQGHRVRAISFFRQMLPLARKIEYKQGEAKIYNGLGVTYRYQGNYNKALDLYKKALAIRKQESNKKGMAGSYHNIGTIYKKQSNYSKAMELYQLALDINQQINNPEWIMYNYIGIGDVCHKRGDLLCAAKVYRKAWKLALQVDNKRGVAFGYYNMGTIYEDQRDYTTALDFYQKAQKQGKKIGNNRVLMRSCNGLGDIYLRLGAFAKAEQHLQKSIKIARKIESKIHVATNYLSLGRLALQRQQFVQAQTYFRKALILREQMGEKDLSAEALVNMGIAYFYQKTYYKALTHLEKGVHIAQKLGNSDIIRDGAQTLAKVYQALGRYQKAYESHRLFKQMADSLFNEKKARQLGRLEVKHAFEKKEDSLQLVRDKKNALLNAEIKQRKLVQTTTFIGLSLTFALILVLIFFYRQKQQNNLRLNQANQYLENFNNELQVAHKEIKAVNNALQQQQEKIIIQHQAIEQQNDELSTQNRKINQSLKSAKTIQEAMLPFEVRLKEILNNYFVIYRPRDIVSGDFYWAGQVQNKRIVATVDCTGHGIPGAFMSMIGFNLLNEIINTKQITEPTSILEQLRYDVRYVLRQDETGSRNGMDVAVVVLEELNKQQTKVNFAGAKRPLLYIQKGDTETQIVKGSPVSIGVIYLKPKNIATTPLICNKNTILYLGTDGFADQNNIDRRRIGTQGFMNLLFQYHTLPLSEQKQALNKALNEHMEGTEQRDDILLMGIQL